MPRSLRRISTTSTLLYVVLNCVKFGNSLKGSVHTKPKIHSRHFIDELFLTFYCSFRTGSGTTTLKYTL